MYNSLNVSDYHSEKMLRCNGHEIMGGGKLVKEQHCLSQAL